MKKVSLAVILVLLSISAISQKVVYVDSMTDRRLLMYQDSITSRTKQLRHIAYVKKCFDSAKTIGQYDKICRRLKQLDGKLIWDALPTYTLTAYAILKYGNDTIRKFYVQDPLPSPKMKVVYRKRTARSPTPPPQRDSTLLIQYQRMLVNGTTIIDSTRKMTFLNH